MTFVHRLDGIDVSHHQHDVAPIDFDRVRAIPTDWCATKATQSTTYRDPTFTRHWAEMQRVGFRWRLAYHWLSPSTDPVAQAIHFLKTWDRTGGAMLDAEEAGITVDKCVAWLQQVEAVTRRPCSVYTGIYVAAGTIWRSPRIREGAYGPRPMHLAAYTTPARLVSLLQGAGVAQLAVHAWQYSSDGPVPGVTGRCDMNQILDRAIYDKACAVQPVPQPGPIPLPSPVPLPEEGPVIRVRFSGYANQFSHDGGKYSHITQEMAAAYTNAPLLTLNRDLPGGQTAFLSALADNHLTVADLTPG